MSSRRARSMYALAVTVISVGPVLLAGATPWPQVFGVAGMAALVASTRWGIARGAAAAAVSVFMTLLGGALLAPLVPFSLRAVTVASLVACGFVVGAGAWFVGPPTAARLRSAGAVALAAGWGSVVWLVALALAQVVPGSTAVGWALQGDAAPHLVQARAVLAHGGVDAALLEHNPVPLLHAAVAQLAGADAASGILAAQVELFAQFWAVIIAGAGVLGALAARQIALHAGARRSSELWVTAVASAASLTWFYVGYPVKYGFINSHVVMIALASLIIAAVVLGRSPWWALTASAAIGVLLLVTWSPLAGLAAVVGVVALARIVRTRARPRLAAGLAAGTASALAVGYVVVFQLPLLRAAGGALAVDGGLVHFPEPMLPLALVTCGALVWMAVGRQDRWSGSALIAFLVTGGLGLGATITIAGNPLLGPWTYYPQKYAWQVATIVLLMGWGALGGLADRVKRGRRIVLALPAAIVVIALGPLMFVPGVVGEQLGAVLAVRNVVPLSFKDPEERKEAILAAENSDRVVVMWLTEEEFQSGFNHWRLQLARERIEDEPTRQLLHVRSHFLYEAQETCEVAEALGDDVIILTSSEDAAAILETTCPGVRLDVRYSPRWTPRDIAEVR